MSRRLLPITSYVQENHLKKEFLFDLQQRRIDEKFKYIGEQQANAWFNICNSPDYDHHRKPMKFLENCIQDLVSDHKGDVNVIALGPGDALKEQVVVDTFLEKHRVSLFFVDISREILNVAIQNVGDRDELKEVFIADLSKFMDIEDIGRYVKRHYNSTNFFTLLGNTLGNYPQAMILTTFRNAMKPGDKVLIEVHAKSTESLEEEQIDETLKGYDNPIYTEQLIASLSAAGIDGTDGTIEVEFNADKFFPQIDVVEQYFCFDRNKVVNYEGTQIYFAKGERILVDYSNKYTLESLKHLLTSHGLRTIKHTKDETGKYYLMLCELA